MAHRLIPLTPPLFFHFTLPLTTLSGGMCVASVGSCGDSTLTRSLSLVVCGESTRSFFQNPYFSFLIARALLYWLIPFGLLPVHIVLYMNVLLSTKECIWLVF